MPKELEILEIPELYENALELYWLLRSGEMLTYGEVVAYTRLMGVKVDPHEVEKMMQIDRVVRKLMSVEDRKRHGKKQPDN